MARGAAVAQRATDSLERSTSTIPLNASGGESGSDLGRTFGFPLFFFSFLFIFSCLVLFGRKYSSLRLSRDLPTGQMCQIPNTAWSLCQERVPACLRVIMQRVGETGCSLHYRKEKEKNLGRVHFESREKRKEEDEALQHACV